MEKPIVFWRSARRHRIGKGHARHVMQSATPVPVDRTGDLDPQLVWLGPDDRGVWLEIIALDLPDCVVVIHVMPLYRMKDRG